MSVLGPIPFAVGTVIMLVISTVAMLVIDPILGVVAIVVFPLLIATNVIYERRVSGHFARAQHQLGEFSAGVHESFEGVQLVKSYGAEERETERLSGLADQVRSSRVHAIRMRSWFEAILDVIPSLTNILLVLLGSLRVRSGDLTIGELSGVIFLFTLLIFPLRLIGYALSELPRSIAAWNRIQTVLHEPIEPDPVDHIGRAPDQVGVRFDHVSFTHAVSPPSRRWPTDDQGRVALAAEGQRHRAGRADRVRQVHTRPVGDRPDRTHGRQRESANPAFVASCSRRHS